MSGEGEYGLVMPFVIVESVGGPYDDEAFTVGWEMGELDAWLQSARTRLEASEPGGTRKMVHSTAVAQADLLAMKNGYQMTTEATEVDSWTTLTFTPALAEVVDS